MNGAIRQTQKLIPDFTSDKLIFASTASEGESLWAARKEALWALLAVRPKNTEIWSTDVAVPISRLAEIVGMYFYFLLCSFLFFFQKKSAPDKAPANITKIFPRRNRVNWDSFQPFSAMLGMATFTKQSCTIQKTLSNTRQ